MKKAKFKKLKQKKNKNSFLIGITIIFICFFCFLFLNYINKKITPKLVEIASKNIEKLTYNIFNDYSILEDIDSSILQNTLIINKNKDNQIINVSYNLKNAYTITNLLANRIQADYLRIESGNKRIEYYDEELSNLADGLILNIPIGIASDKIYFANLGPKIPIKVKLVGTLLTNLKTKMQNYGINNVLIELYVDVAITHEITTPVTFQTNELKYEILIGAEIINGEVPSYYGGQFETKSNILNIPLE